MLLVPFLAGSLVTAFMKSEQDSFSLQYLCGILFMFMLTLVLALPMIFMGSKLSTLAIIWSIVLLVVCILSMIVNRTRLTRIIKETVCSFEKFPWYGFIVIVLIFFQIFMYVYFQHIDDDDAFFVASAVTAVDTDSLFHYNTYTGLPETSFEMRYVISPFPMFTAVISFLTSIHAAILAHTVLPVFWVLLAYMVYYLLGACLFKNDVRKIYLFLLFACFLNIFGGSAVYMSTHFMLVRIWQGKSIIASVLIPAIAYLAVRTMYQKGNWADWLALCFAMGGAALLSSMGIYLAPLTLGILTVAYLISHRKFKVILYAAVSCLPCIISGIVYIIMR